MELFLTPLLIGEKSVQPKRGIVEHNFYSKPTKKHPKVLHAIITGSGEVILTEVHPFDHKELPVIHFLEIYDPSSIWGTSTAEQVRSQQARYNRVSSAVLENINLTANVQWLNTKGSGNTARTNQPGRSYEHRPGRAPSQLQPKGMPQYVDAYLNRIRSDMQDTASSHDVSEAKAEPGVRSGRAVLALQDADDSILGPTLVWFDKAISKVGRLAMQTLAQFVSEDTIINIRGEFIEEQAITFNREALKGETKG